MSEFNSHKKKLKVVWLCGFTNELVQQKINPRRRRGEIAPWINNLIQVFEHNQDIELHIITPHLHISKYKQFSHNGIFYHVFNQGIPLLGINWPPFFPMDLWTDYLLIKRKVRSIINRIKPDIIHLHGAENTFHTAAILQFHEKLPVFITIQGFINKSGAKGKRIVRRQERERKIYQTFSHFGYRTETMGNTIKEFNKNAVLHWHRYPIKPIEVGETEKIFDIVFFARLSKDKGIEDLLRAVSQLKQAKEDISLCVIGGGKSDYLKELSESLDIQENITWAGFLPTQKDVHLLASKARISVLPTYNDIISGTIVESLLLGLPVVAYDVGSIHEINKNEEVISLLPKGDVNGLTNAINQLLSNSDLLSERSEKSRLRAVEMFLPDEQQIKQDILAAYGKVIQDFQNKKMKK